MVINVKKLTDSKRHIEYLSHNSFALKLTTLQCLGLVVL